MGYHVDINFPEVDLAGILHPPTTLYVPILSRLAPIGGSIVSR